MKNTAKKFGENKKAFVFTLDAFLSIIVTMLLIGAANSYILKNDDATPNLQTSKTGYDIVALLDNKNTLQTLNSATVESELSNVLPNKYQMRINVTWQSIELSSKNSFVVGSEIPEKKFVASGKRFFVVYNSYGNTTNYGIAKYWVWLK